MNNNPFELTPLQNLRIDIMIGMLNGSFPWEKGCYLRSLSDEELQKEVDSIQETTK
jgi:hypothetical protein